MKRNQKSRINVAIIGGGFSNERDVSLNTSRQIAKTISAEKYNISFIEITRDKKFILHDNFDTLAFISEQKSSSSKNQGIVPFKKNTSIGKDFFSLKNSVDVAFIALHGKNGEDGKIQAMLDLLDIPYTGSGVLASALGMNKIKCSQFVGKNGIKTPKFIFVFKNKLEVKSIANEVLKKIGYPCVVKPNESGSSIGISVAKNKSELLIAIKKAFKEDQIILIEEYILGREFTCGVMGNTGQAELIAMPLIEIITHGSKFFDYKTKYFSKTVEEVCPAKISNKLTTDIQNKAKYVHELIGCDGLTRSDFILSSKNNEVYFLEINTIPGQTEASLCPKEAMAMGISFADFLEKQINLALEKYESKK